MGPSKHGTRPGSKPATQESSWSASLGSPATAMPSSRKKNYVRAGRMRTVRPRSDYRRVSSVGNQTGAEIWLGGWAIPDQSSPPIPPTLCTGKKHWVLMGVHAATHKVELRHACLPVLCVYASSSSSVEALQLVKDWIVSSGGAGRAHGRRSCCWSSAARLVQEVLCDAC
jgi:hypothetical protein